MVPTTSFKSHRGQPVVALDQRSPNFRGARVTVMGLGRHGGGSAAVRYLARRGAHVTISDRADRDILAPTLEQLADLDAVQLRLGAHDPRDFSTAEWIVVNPAVRPDHECLRIARRAGATITSETELFLRACPAQVIGVTGSNGKSTTCSMLAEVLAAAGRRVWLGGNIGHSLLGDLDAMSSDDWVVLEMSSFQLAHLSAECPLPAWAIVTNVTPNHLDWHGDFEQYAAAKRRLVCEGGQRGVVFDRHATGLAAWSAALGDRVIAPCPIPELPPLLVPGLHNLRNAALVSATAQAVSVPRDVIQKSLANFRGLHHRLELVGEFAGRRFYNDSKSTTPEATVAALQAVNEPTWLLAGGVSKGASFNALAVAIANRARGAGLFGAAREEMAAAIRDYRSDFPLFVSEALPEAFAWCTEHAQVGDAILLSPACASLDQFADFYQRGERFCALVQQLASDVRA